MLVSSVALTERGGYALLSVVLFCSLYPHV